MKRLEAEMAAIAMMPEEELRATWERISAEPMPRVAPRILRQLVAYRLQERAKTGLPRLVRRELLRLAAGPEHGLNNGKEAVCHPPRISPGARLVREWNGQTILVDVLDTGFTYDGKAWNSLSEIARHVTGSHRSGPRFFGLTRHG